MRKYILAAMTSVLCIGMAVVPAQAASYGSPTAPPRAAAGHLSTHSPNIDGIDICDNGSVFLCLRDPSDGGPGTSVLMSHYSGTNAMLWGFFDSKECGSIVGGPNGSEPDCPSAALVNRYKGDRIYYIWNQGSAYCLGANASTGWGGQMKTCDLTNGQFIRSSSNYLVSVDYSTTHGSQFGWLCGSDTSNAEVTVTPQCSPQNLAVWN